MEKNSTCSVNFAHLSDLHGGEGCWMHGGYRRAIVLVIDAMKFEFMRHDNESQENIPYKNKLSIVHHLLSTKPLNSKLYKFLADPPTTTLQRLKGLTTGSLPTFVDAGANFASSEITEDNFIDQLVKQGKVIQFMGDDTWMGLYPGRFKRSFPFPSFNVKDLHTVDNGILEHLLPRLRKRDWDVTIAHFLGVLLPLLYYYMFNMVRGDFQPQMIFCNGSQCNLRFQKIFYLSFHFRMNVTREMSSDTVLFVLGDHGMTRTGDHGGDSQDELEAGLFIYSPTQISAVPYSAERTETVSQKDFVPTVSLMLGVPIPFSNLGRVITDLFTHCPTWKTGSSPIKQLFHSVKALRLNAHQINTYLQEYFQHSSDFPIQTYYQLKSVLDNAETELNQFLTVLVQDGENSVMKEKLEKLRDKYIYYIDEVRKTAEGVWAKFDIMSMTIGVLTLILALSVNVYFIKISFWWKRDVPSTMVVVFLVFLVYLAFAVFQSFFYRGEYSALMVLLMGTCLLFGTLLLTLNFKPNNPLILNKKEPSFPRLDSAEYFLAVLVTALIFVIFFSNSFVVYEDSISLYLLQSLSWFLSFSVIRHILRQFETSTDPKTKKQKAPRNFDIMRVLTHPALVLIFLTLAWSLFLRLSSAFRVCREEQHQCEASIFLQPLGNLNDQESVKNGRYFFSLICIALMVFLLRQVTRHFGNLNGSSAPVLGVKYLPPLAAVCSALHWALQGLPQKSLDSLPPWQQVFLPRAVYVLVALLVMFIIYDPLCIYVVLRSKRLVVDNNQQLIPNLYHQLKENMAENEEGKPPLVYGLATSFSAATIAMVTVGVLFLGLLLGDGMMPSLVLVILSVYCFLEILAIRESLNLPVPLWFSSVYLSVLGWVFFYATGH
nr:LOW QUALITY PROTEIN: GPI ethanolamine phosphate transferase 3-like [Crassostrea gigas]